jgi:GrpB-like predicted nucleotidyltransferase (UPF0157 family)
MGEVQILTPDPRWPHEFADVARRVRDALGDRALRIDHIGSTSVPDLPAKDVIDIQVTIREDGDLAPVAARLQDAGWTFLPDFPHRDHHVPGLPEAGDQWRKAFVREPAGERRVNVHIRVDGRANQRYALLFRDFLREHPSSAAAYGNLKRGLATLALSIDVYADLKDPACDLIYLAAEAWAKTTGWRPRPSDA